MEELVPSEEMQIARTKQIHAILDGYDLDNITVAMVASHSALDLADGAKDEGLSTLAMCEDGREKTYRRFSRIINRLKVLRNFKDLMNKEIQEELRKNSAIFVPNRSLTTYVPIEKIESEFQVPMFGNRFMLRADGRREQKKIFESANIRHPKKFESYNEIDRICMVKAVEPIKKIERAFFTCATPEEFLRKWKARFGERRPEDLDRQLRNGEIWIEEFVFGAQFNFNYFYSPINDRIDFLGIDRRIQTDIDGILRLPAEDQIGRKIEAEYIEIGHESATIRESMLEKVYKLGEDFVDAAKHMYPNGIIGPFALQGAVDKNLEIVVYDLSPRMPGSPVLYSSPYSKYFFGQNITSGRRVAMEIRQAIDERKLKQIIT